MGNKMNFFSIEIVSLVHASSYEQGTKLKQIQRQPITWPTNKT